MLFVKSLCIVKLKMKQLLTHGLQNGRLVHIDDVATGLACNCVCSNCKHPLVAKNQGNQKAHHFAHHSVEECEGAVESALHLLAKQVFFDTKSLFTPDYHNYTPDNDISFLKEGKLIEFDSVVLEKSIEVKGSRIVADAVGIKDGRELIVEFANTHFVDEEKHWKLEQMGLSSIEVDISDQPLDFEVIKEQLNTNVNTKYWLNSPYFDRQFVKFCHDVSLKRSRRAKKKAESQAQKKKYQIERFQQYRLSGEHKLYKMDDGQAKRCPLPRLELKELKKSWFYNHPILKRIIEGEFWNGKFYRNHNTGEVKIWLSGEEIIVYPSRYENREYSAFEKKQVALFYRGLNDIDSILHSDINGICEVCEYKADFIEIDNDLYAACNDKAIPR